MTTLTLAKLDEIKAAAAKATPGPWSWDGKVWNYDSEQEAPWLVADRKSIVTGAVHCSEANATFIALCDPATVAALCRDARRYVWLRDNATPPTLASIAWGHSTTACEFSEPDDAIDAALREERG